MFAVPAFGAAILGGGPASAVPANALLWDDGVPLLWDDSTYLLWS